MRDRKPKNRGWRQVITSLLTMSAGLAIHLQAIAQASADAVPAKAALCAACHGEGGRSTITTNPVLAGQTARYMYLQLRDFQAGRRSDPAMTPMVDGLTRDDMLVHCRVGHPEK